LVRSAIFFIKYTYNVLFTLVIVITLYHVQCAVE